MKRASLLAVVDQALLSALNLVVALLLIGYSAKAQYGLYAQLVNLQSLFSPLHASLFVSAFMTLAARYEGKRLEAFRAGMARAELGVTFVSAVLVALITYSLAGVLNAAFSWSVCIASAAALLSLWWREFVRQIHFASLDYTAALRVGASYTGCVMVGLIGLATCNALSAQNIFIVMAVASSTVAFGTIVKLARFHSSQPIPIAADLSSSWQIGRWELIGSFVTWGSSQSYLYFASLHGGVDMVAEVSAARLFASPLALLWIAQANVLRPHASRYFAAGDLHGVRRLARASLLIVLAASSAYAAALFGGLALASDFLGEKGFTHTTSLALAWVGYFAITGASTSAAGILRSRLEFGQVLAFQVVACGIALALLGTGTAMHSPLASVLPLLAAEAVFACLLYHRLRFILRPTSMQTAPCDLRSQTFS